VNGAPSVTTRTTRSYHYLANLCLGQSATFKQENPARSRGETPVMSDDDHTNLEVINYLYQ